MDKLKIKEAIVVEGRDDTAALRPVNLGGRRLAQQPDPCLKKGARTSPFF